MKAETVSAVRRRELSKDVAVCGLFSALIAVGAFIKVVIPAGADTMNFTLQWFFVLLAAFLLGSKRAFLSVSVYLAIGLLGVPVFARGGGPAYIIRPTFGFLLGFAAAAFAAGRICEMRRPLRPAVLAAASAAGYLLYYGFGMVYFYLIMFFTAPQPVGWKMIFLVYCMPTMLPDIALCVLAAVAARRLRPAVRPLFEEETGRNR